MALHSLAVNETLDSILDESGDEEEQEAVVNQVLDEIGIEISGRVSKIRWNHFKNSRYWYTINKVLFFGFTMDAGASKWSHW